MSIALVNKIDMKTVIVTEDREYKRIAVNFMNSIAFPAEKLTAQSINELTSIINSNQSALNVVVDGNRIFNAANLKEDLEAIQKLTSKDKISILVTVTESQKEKIDQLNIAERNLFFEAEVNKATYNRAFHEARDGRSRSIFSVKKAPVEKKENLIALESTQHIKETIESIKQLASDPTDIPSLLLIGQRFNGLVGSMAFLGAKAGWKEIKILSEFIDTIAKHYEKGDFSEISTKHVEFLIKSAKCCFLILKSLRDFKPIETSLIEEAFALSMRFKSFTEIKTREKHDQDAVDALLKNIS